MRLVLFTALAFVVSCAPVRPIPTVTAESPGSLLLLSSADVPATPVCPDVITFPRVVTSDAADEFVATLALCARPVLVEIDSVGGSVGAARGIMKAIERHPHKVTCVVDGMAMSAAFDILQVCDERLMTPRSQLMQHNASDPRPSPGMQNEMINSAEMLRVIDEGRAQLCSRRMGMPLDEYKAHIAGGLEWHMSLLDALKFHAVDSEVDSVSAALHLLGL